MAAAAISLSPGCAPLERQADTAALFAMPGLATAAEARETSERPLRLRIHVSGSYAAAPMGTHEHIREIVRKADAVLWSTVGAHLVIEQIVDGWRVDVGDSAEALRALMNDDPAAGGDVVVGLLGGASKREDGCLGMASVGGGYMVVRSEDAERGGQSDLAVVAFLHELGHALGARHDDEPGSIMNTPAAPSSTSFGRAATEVMRSGLVRRGIAPAQWPSLARPRPRPLPLPQSAAAAAGPAPVVGHTPTVAGVDRLTLDRALEAERRGDIEQAWHVAEPLFSAYPDVLEVQGLRCRLANAQDLPWADVRVECRAFMRMMVPGASPLE